MDAGTKQTDLARVLAAIGTDNRLAILQLLRDRALCVGAIAKRLEISQSAVSQHLRILKEAGLVIAERRGYFIHYRINEKGFSEIMTFAKGFIGIQQKKCQSSDCERR